MGLGFSGAVFAAAHAYVFRGILGAVSDPDDIGEQLSFLASDQASSSYGSSLPLACGTCSCRCSHGSGELGCGWPATAAVAGMFAVAVINCHIGPGNVWYASDH